MGVEKGPLDSPAWRPSGTLLGTVSEGMGGEQLETTDLGNLFEKLYCNEEKKWGSV